MLDAARESDDTTDPHDIEYLEAYKKVCNAVASHSPSLSYVEATLGLESGFVAGLLDEEDDWAFIIKTAVVVEATLGRVIVSMLQPSKVTRHIRTLPMDGRTGKIQLAYDLGIIGAKSMARLRAFAEIRNDFAHDLKVMQLSLPDYFSKLAEPERSSLYSRLVDTDGDKSVSNTTNKLTAPSSAKFDERAPKLILWGCACLALLELSAAYRRIHHDINWKSTMVMFGESYRSKLRGDEHASKERMKEAVSTLEKMTAEMQSFTPERE